MTDINRRRFMQLAGGAAAMSVLSNSIARAAEIPANRRTGSLKDIEHIVVLMQENRSFDHYFGTLRGVRGFGDPRPVKQPNGKSVFYQSDGTKDVLPFRPAADNLGMRFIQGTPHDWNTSHAALNQGRFDKWIPAKTTTSMAHLTREDIPFHFALADTFTICDAYHCSLLGPTDPNRYYMWTGYCGNDGKGGGPVITNAEAGYDWTTYPERLEKAGVSWKVYQDVGDGLDAKGSWGWIEDAYRGNYGDNALLYFHQYQNAKPGDPLYDKARTGTNAKAGEGFFDILRADVKAGKLPQVSWVVAPEAFCEHPNWPVNYGAWYIAQVLDALTSDPEVWSKTALLITYDENDGFFDHVVQPFPPATPAQGASTADTALELYRPTVGDSHVPGQYGLGQRVPMFVVSPWSKGGWVNSQTFDHTSIIQFIERRFGVTEPNISPWRRTVCGDLTTAFDFSKTEPAVPALPATAGYLPPDRVRHPDFVPTPPANPVLPKQEPGLRNARALPYDFAVDGRVDQDGLLRIEFAANGEAGGTFLVTSASDPTGPWTYTVGSGSRLSGTWAAAAGYDFSVHGPNGFLREFKGAATVGAGFEVTARQDGGSEELRLVLTNPGVTPVRVTVTDGYGHLAPTELRLQPGATVTHTVSTKAANGWYDLSIASDTGRRRLAGHLETGRPSTSDPATA